MTTARGRPVVTEAVDRCFAGDCASVLDIGCGAGRVSHLLDECGFHVTGIDVSESLVERAWTLFPGIDVRVADVGDSPFEAASFGYAVFSFLRRCWLARRPKCLRG